MKGDTILVVLGLFLLLLFLLVIASEAVAAAALPVIGRARVVRIRRTRIKTSRRPDRARVSIAEMNSFERGIRLVAGVLLIPSSGFFLVIEFALTRARQFSEEKLSSTQSPTKRGTESYRSPPLIGFHTTGEYSTADYECAAL